MTDHMWNQTLECSAQVDDLQEMAQRQRVPSQVGGRRVFLAHPKGLEDRELEQLYAATKRLVDASTTPAEVVLGRDDYMQHAANNRNWAGWIHAVASGMEYRGSVPAPRFTSYIVAPEREVGKATAQIVEKALAAGKPVYFFDGVREFARVTGVAQVRENDFKAGWRVY